MERLKEIKREITSMAEREAIRLFRIARKAKEHGCSYKLVHTIIEEANLCHRYAHDPEVFLHWQFEEITKYAFR